jgi:hypothetical protein
MSLAIIAYTDMSLAEKKTYTGMNLWKNNVYQYESSKNRFISVNRFF